MRDIVLIVIVLICSLTALRRPVFGILAFVCLGLLNPNSLAWGVGRTFPFALLTALGTLVGYVFWNEPKKFPLTRESVFMLALWGMFGISTLFPIYPDRAFAALIYISKVLLMVFLSISIINTDHRLHLLLRVIALSLGFHALKGGLFAMLSGGNYTVYGPEGSFLEANNSIGLALAMNAPLLFYLTKMESHPWFRRLMQAMFVLSYPAVVFTYSRGAWLGLGAATALMVWKSRHRVLALAAVGMLVLMVLPFLPQRLSERYDELVNYQEEGSAQSRFWNWEFCTRVGLAHPFHGGGFDFYSEESYSKYFPEFRERWPGKVWSCHSMWFTILGEHGIPGFVLWVGLIGFSLLSVRQIRVYQKTHSEKEWLVHYADMLQGSFVAYIVVGSFLDAAYFDLFYYLVAILIILKERIRYDEFKSHSPAAMTGVEIPVLSS